MENNIKSLWARIILTSYRNIPRVVKSLDRTIDCVAMQGMGRKGSYMPADVLIERIIDLIYRKQGLINLKVITEDVISNMSKDYVKLLKLKYLYNKKFQEIADIMNISIRTTFRHYDKALHQFCCILKLKGFSDKKLDEEYKDEPYISNIREKTIKEYITMNQAINNRQNAIKVKKVLKNINITYEGEIKAESY